jgi:hypothetical protein
MLLFDQGGTIGSAARLALRRRMLKAGVVLLSLLAVLLFLVVGVPRLSSLELAVLGGCATLLWGSRLFRAFNRALSFWLFRRR